MLILGMDTATLSCSVALLQEETVLAEFTLNIRKTHSERLMPLLDHMLVESGIEREQIGAVSVSAGPGSFTGLRIGVATARGLAQALSIPAVPVCTLAAMAEVVPTPGALICPLLDARRGEVYTALFKRSAHSPYALKTVLEPIAIPLKELAAYLRQALGPLEQKMNLQQEEISLQREEAGPRQEILSPESIVLINRQAGDEPIPSPNPVVFLGEGLHIHGEALTTELPGIAVIPSGAHRFCRAALVALRGKRLLEANPEASYLQLLPSYLRRPEAEIKAAQQEEGGACG